MIFTSWSHFQISEVGKIESTIFIIGVKYCCWFQEDVFGVRIWLVMTLVSQAESGLRLTYTSIKNFFG